MFWIDRNKPAFTMSWGGGRPDTHVTWGRVIEIFYEDDILDIVKHQVENIIGKVFDI